MGDLITQGVRSIILTSGTLSPLQSFSSELQMLVSSELETLQFPLPLECLSVSVI